MCLCIDLKRSLDCKLQHLFQPLGNKENHREARWLNLNIRTRIKSNVSYGAKPTWKCEETHANCPMTFPALEYSHTWNFTGWSSITPISLNTINGQKGTHPKLLVEIGEVARSNSASDLSSRLPHHLREMRWHGVRRAVFRY